MVIHRYTMLGVLDEKGSPRQEMEILETLRSKDEPALTKGTKCGKCGNMTVIRKDG